MHNLLKLYWVVVRHHLGKCQAPTVEAKLTCPLVEDLLNCSCCCISFNIAYLSLESSVYCGKLLREKVVTCEVNSS